ncbi:MAG: NUDIX hydrolase [Candidatus Omnitrophota bacterium]
MRNKNVLSSRIALNGKLLKVFVDKVVLPNGYTTRLEYIRHPGAVAVVPFLSSKRIILIRQWRPVIRRFIWEIPAGTRDGKESHARCARRELIEEVGQTAKTIRKVGAIYTTPGFTDEFIWIYEARGLRPVRSTPERDEIIVKKVFSAHEVRRMYRCGRIVDSKTIAALAKCGVL